MDDNPDVTPTTDAPGGLTIAQAAALLKVHANTVRKRVKDGTLPSQRVLTPNGLVYVIPRSALPGGDEPSAPGNTDVNAVALVPSEGALMEGVNLAVTAALAPLLEAMEAREEAHRVERERLQALTQEQAAELGALRERAARVERLEAELDRMRRPWWRRLLG